MEPLGCQDFLIPLIRTPVTCAFELFRDSAAPAALILARREHDHHGEPAPHVVGRTKETNARLCHGKLSATRAVSDETAQTPSLSQVPASRGATANTAGCASPGTARCCRLRPLSQRSEHVLLQTALTPSFRQRVPATQNEKPPCNIAWWMEIKRTVQSPPLCLHRESSPNPQRLWPGAQWTVAVQGTNGARWTNLKGTNTSDVIQQNAEQPEQWTQTLLTRDKVDDRPDLRR